MAQRYVMSKAKEVFDEKLKDTRICHAGMMCTSKSLSNIFLIANNAQYDCVISEKKEVSSLCGRKKY